MKRVFSLFVISIVLLSSGCISSIEKDIFEGEDINSSLQFSEFNLTDSEGDFFNSETLSGQILIINFFYTNCPDHCPTMTSELKQVYQEFETHIGLNISFLSITVDPWRDASSSMKDYMDYFNVSWPHLTIEFLNDENLSEIENIWTEFEIGVLLTESENSTSISGRGHTVYYSIEHTNGIVIVDRDGYQRVRWDESNWDSDGIENDINKLLKESPSDS
jgi:protein SCO1/2